MTRSNAKERWRSQVAGTQMLSARSRASSPSYKTPLGRILNAAFSGSACRRMSIPMEQVSSSHRPWSRGRSQKGGDTCGLPARHLSVAAGTKTVRIRR
jgi:hypothetical protein